MRSQNQTINHYFGDCNNIYAIYITTQEFSFLGIAILASAMERGPEVISIIDRSVEAIDTAVKTRSFWDRSILNWDEGRREGLSV